MTKKNKIFLISLFVIAFLYFTKSYIEATNIEEIPINHPDFESIYLGMSVDDLMKEKNVIAFDSDTEINTNLYIEYHDIPGNYTYYTVGSYFERLENVHNLEKFKFKHQLIEKYNSIIKSINKQNLKVKYLKKYFQKREYLECELSNENLSITIRIDYEIDNSNEKEYVFDMFIFKNKDVINNNDTKTNYISKNKFDKILLEL